MLQSKVLYPTGETCEAIVLKTAEDLLEYIAYERKISEDFINRLFKSDIPTSRWSHISEKSPAGANFKAVMTRAKLDLTSDNFWVEMDKMQQNKYVSMQSKIHDGWFLVVNSMGSYFPSRDESILSQIRPYDIITEDTHKIIKGSKYINLENDPVLEKYVMNYFSGATFSYILNLRAYDDNRLLEVLTKFKQAGGEGLFQYTTGTDVNQMYTYAEKAIDSGISEFIFHFNAGETPEILEFLKWLKNKPEVTLAYNFV